MVLLKSRNFAPVFQVFADLEYADYPLSRVRAYDNYGEGISRKSIIHFIVSHLII